MLQSSTLKFMEQLALNNNKPWFDEHRDEYQATKADFEQLVAQVLGEMVKIDASLNGILPKDCIMRIFRDIRFSKDKTPYKTNLGAGFSGGGRKFLGAGYYLHIQPGGKSFVGGGLWQPEGKVLKALRQEIDYGFGDFSNIISGKKFKKLFLSVDGEKLSRPPQGYDANNPAIEYLMLKSFTVSHSKTDSELTSKDLVKKIVDIYAEMKPFVDFLNRAFA